MRDDRPGPITVTTGMDRGETVLVLHTPDAMDSTHELDIDEACDLFARLGKALFAANGNTLGRGHTVRVRGDWVEIGTEDTPGATQGAYLHVVADDDVIVLDTAEATDTAVYLLGHAAGSR